jgi:hypothetical protein
MGFKTFIFLRFFLVTVSVNGFVGSVFFDGVYSAGHPERKFEKEFS